MQLWSIVVLLMAFVTSCLIHAMLLPTKHLHVRLYEVVQPRILDALLCTAACELHAAAQPESPISADHAFAGVCRVLLVQAWRAQAGVAEHLQ